MHLKRNGCNGIDLRRMPVDNGNMHLFGDSDRHQRSLVHAFQRGMQTVVIDEQVGIGEFDREVVHGLTDLLENRAHCLLALVAILNGQDVGALVPQCRQHVRVLSDRARHLDHRLLLQVVHQVHALNAGKLALSLHLSAVHCLQVGQLAGGPFGEGCDVDAMPFGGL
ncbi:MAG TPA: hypothetical protein VN738_07710, partial [Acidothermaceae bacterium]|nr:hypothetical protein [Acidothermaceae bacterium]